MSEWKLFCTLLGAALSISAALLSMTESVPVWAIIPVIITAVVAVVIIGQNIIDSCRRFADTATWQRRRIWIGDRKSTRLNSSHVAISYAVFCLKKKKNAVRDDDPVQQ